MKIGIANLLSLVQRLNKPTVTFENWRHIITNTRQANGRPYNILLCDIKSYSIKLAFDMNKLKNKTKNEAIKEARKKGDTLLKFLRENNQSLENIEGQVYYEQFGIWINPEFIR